MVTAIRLISAVVNPASSSFCANIAKPSATGGLALLPQVGREHSALYAGRANVGEDRFARRLVGVIGGEAVLDDRAQIGEFGLLGAGEILRRKFGVRDDDAFDAQAPAPP